MSSSHTANPKTWKAHTTPYTWKSPKNSHRGSTSFMRTAPSNRSRKSLSTAPFARPTFNSSHFSASSLTTCCSSDSCLYLNVYRHWKPAQMCIVCISSSPQTFASLRQTTSSSDRLSSNQPSLNNKLKMTTALAKASMFAISIEETKLIKPCRRKRKRTRHRLTVKKN